MKKTYISPEMTVVEMEYRQMLCASIQKSDNSLQVTFDGSTFDDDGSIN